MVDGWLEHDQVRVDRLPEWARAAAAAMVRAPRPVVTIAREGIVALERQGAVTARWDEVLGVTIVGDRGHVFVGRRPPLPPWIALEAGHLAGDAAALGVAETIRTIRQRTAGTSYRDHQSTALSISFEEAVSRIRARAPVPGALEIPPSFGPGREAIHARRRFSALLALGGGGGMGAYVGFFLTMPLAATLGTAGVVALTAAAALCGGGGMYVIDDFYRRKTQRRALALMPHGGMIGLPSGVYPFRWSEVEGFESVPADDGRRALRVRGPRWSRETLDETWFEAPIDLVVAAAEAYRTRWSR